MYDIVQTVEAQLSLNPRPCLSHNLFVLLAYSFFWPHCVACGIFVRQLGIEPGPSEVKVPSPNHWSARGFPLFVLLILHL